MDTKSALQELKQFETTRKGAGDYLAQQKNELGVQGAQQRTDDIRGLIRNTETALKGVGQSVAGRTRGNLVTEAQRSRLQQLETQPIAQQLADRSGEFSDAQTNYRDLLSQASQNAQMSYQTDADKLSSLQGRYDRLFQADQAAEAKRQFEENLRLQREEAERNRRAAAAQAQMAQASLYNPTLGGGGGGGGGTQYTPSYDKSGRIVGYGSKGGQSFLTPEGKAAEDAYWKKQNSGFKVDPFKNILKNGPMALLGKGLFW